jgi:hypothetical protein
MGPKIMSIMVHKPVARGAKKDRLEKLKRDLSKFDQKYSLFVRQDKNKEDLKNIDIETTFFQLSPNIENYWQTVLSASKNVAEHIFNTPDNQYPLFLSKSSSGPGQVRVRITRIATKKEKNTG